MKRTGALAITLTLCACVGEPGGGGVNIDTTPAMSVVTTTTSSTLPATTTTLQPTLVVGKVTRPSGSPVAGATVAMGCSYALTGPDGSYSFHTHDPGEITVSKRGWSSVIVPWDVSAVTHDGVIDLGRVRGLRVAAETAGDDVRFSNLLDLAAATAVNALVFDTKREGGQVLYDSSVQAARDIGAVNPVYDPRRRLDQAHDAGLYTITRLVTFEDAHRAAAFPDEKLAGPWVDPTATAAREYNMDLAVEACQIGFDEIQFDYVRYPSGMTAQASGQLDLTEEQRVAAVAGFLSEARAALEPMGCSVSAAIFGIVTSTPDDQGLGQRIEEVSANTHVVSPMVYPSHYSPGWLGFEDPNQFPYEVTADAISDAVPRLASGTQLRPWLQSFWWTDAQVRRSIQAAEDLEVGWIMWNIASNFSSAALPGESEVDG